MSNALLFHAEVKAAISKTFIEPRSVGAALKMFSPSKADTAATLSGSGVTAFVVTGIKEPVLQNAVEKAQSLAIRRNGETELVGSAIHYLDAEVADLVEARFIRFIPDGQLGKLASEIALVRGR